MSNSTAHPSLPETPLTPACHVAPPTPKKILQTLHLPKDFSTPLTLPPETTTTLDAYQPTADSLKLKKQLTTLHLQTASLNHASLALAKLVELTNSKKPEVARRACMSLLKLAHLHNTTNLIPDNDPLFEDQPPPQPKKPLVKAPEKTPSPLTPSPIPHSPPPFSIQHSAFSISPPPPISRLASHLPRFLPILLFLLTLTFFPRSPLMISNSPLQSTPMTPPLPANTLFATVAVDHPLDATYTYAVPAPFAKDLHRGSRVTVPLGRGNRLTPATVLTLSETPPPPPSIENQKSKIENDLPALFESPPSEFRIQNSEFKPLLDLHRDVLPIPADLLDLAQWISTYYCAPIGMTLSTMVPAAVKRATRLPATLLISLTDPTTPPAAQLAALKTSPSTRKIFTLLHPYLAAGPKPEQDVLTHAQIARPALKRLLTQNLLKAEREIKLPSPSLIGADLQQIENQKSKIKNLSPDQQAAIDQLTPLLKENQFAVRLIHGVTGSGKTELYIRAIEQIVAQNKTAIVLVPEISLTPQTVRRFTARFPRVAVLHSGMKDSERHQHWHAIATGWAQVVVGARSAIFAPAQNIGLIVVDEEHDGSYKQDNLPKYHGRDVAIRRAQMLNIPILLGSATPALESWHNAHTHKDWRLLSLTQRPLNTQMPRVLTVDMKSQEKERRGLHILSTVLEHHLRQTLEQKKQAIILLNRRGYAHYLMCPRCDWVMMCDNCDATMVVHRKRLETPADPIKNQKSKIENPRTLQGNVQCHYCLTSMMLPDRCPLCTARLTHLGQGTQRAEDELLRKFPTLRLKRMDSDSMSNAGHYQAALDAFGRGDLDLLIGTQMIAKGLDFPNVQLVGVLNADLAMTIPDFRAAERTFQLICQVAGRSGRVGSSSAGTVVVQTYQPQEPAIAFACNHDYLGFVRTELPHRQEFGYPPYGRLVRIVLAHKSFTKVQTAAEALQRLMTALTQKLSLPIRIQGPFPPPMERLVELYRSEFILFASTPRPLQQLIASLRGRGLVSAGAARVTSEGLANVTITVDVDPLHML